MYFWSHGQSILLTLNYFNTMIRVMPGIPASMFILQDKGAIPRRIVGDDEKKFYNIDTWVQCYETFYDRKLHFFVIS